MCQIHRKKLRGKGARTESYYARWKRRKRSEETKDKFDKCNKLIETMEKLCEEARMHFDNDNNVDVEFSEIMSKPKGKTPEVLFGCRICQEKGHQKWCKNRGAHTRHVNQVHPNAKNEEREAIVCENKDTVMTILGISPAIVEEDDEDLEGSFMSGIINGSATPSTQMPTPESTPSSSANSFASASSGPGTGSGKNNKRGRELESDDEDFPSDSMFDGSAADGAAKKSKADESVIDAEVINSIKESQKKFHDVSAYFNQVREKLNADEGSAFQTEVDSFSAGMDSMYEDLENKYKDAVKCRDDKQKLLEVTMGELQTVKANLKMMEYSLNRVKEQLGEKDKILAEINSTFNLGTGNKDPKADVVAYFSRMKKEIERLKSENELSKKWGEQQKKLADGVQYTLNLLQQNKDQLSKELKDLKKKFPCEKQKQGECLLNEKNCEYLHRPPKSEQ